LTRRPFWAPSFYFATELAPGEQTSFKIQVSNPADGDYSFDVAVPNDDHNESDYEFTIAGRAINNSSIGGGSSNDDSDACSTGAGSGGMMILGGPGMLGVLALRSRRVWGACRRNTTAPPDRGHCFFGHIRSRPTH
jgi:hypothetical protein